MTGSKTLARTGIGGSVVDSACHAGGPVSIPGQCSIHFSTLSVEFSSVPREAGSM